MKVKDHSAMIKAPMTHKKLIKLKQNEVAHPADQKTERRLSAASDLGSIMIGHLQDRTESNLIPDKINKNQVKPQLGPLDRTLPQVFFQNTNMTPTSLTSKEVTQLEKLFVVYYLTNRQKIKETTHIIPTQSIQPNPFWPTLEGTSRQIQCKRMKTRLIVSPGPCPSCRQRISRPIPLAHSFLNSSCIM